MNKAQLLADLAAQSWVSALNGEAKLRETKADGARWYSQSVREVLGTAAIYRSVDFYVLGEGAANEAAFYKDRPPGPTLRGNAPALQSRAPELLARDAGAADVAAQP